MTKTVLVIITTHKFLTVFINDLSPVNAGLFYYTKKTYEIIVSLFKYYLIF